MILCLRRKGQAVIETALILTLIIFIALAITEFSRAWFAKNSLKNAVRGGARLAVVTPSIPTTTTNGTCAGSSCPVSPDDVNDIIDFVCCQSGVRNDATTTVAVSIEDDVPPVLATATRGDTIRVSATFDDDDFFIVGGGFWPWPKDIDITVRAEMRYE